MKASFPVLRRSYIHTEEHFWQFSYSLTFIKLLMVRTLNILNQLVPADIHFNKNMALFEFQSRFGHDVPTVEHGKMLLKKLWCSLVQMIPDEFHSTNSCSVA